jgi:8-oxo-(d)GTP phosphatase
MLIRAAGGVVWRSAGDDVEVALVHRPRYDDWSLPKGKLDPGEPELDAAVREIREEMGAEVEVGHDLGTIDYIVSKRGSTRPKTVRYWALRYTDGEFVANDEVDDLRWLPVAEAAQLASYARDRQVLARFAAMPVG